MYLYVNGLKYICTFKLFHSSIQHSNFQFTMVAKEVILLDRGQRIHVYVHLDDRLIRADSVLVNLYPK